MKRFYYENLESEVCGPITERDLTALYRGGAISDDSEICEEGGEAWVSAGSYFRPSNPMERSHSDNQFSAPVSNQEEQDQKISRNSWVVGFLIAAAIAALVFGPIGYVIETAELAGKIDPPKWIAEVIAFSFLGFMFWVTAAAASFVQSKKDGTKWP